MSVSLLPSVFLFISFHFYLFYLLSLLCLIPSLPLHLLLSYYILSLSFTFVIFLPSSLHFSSLLFHSSLPPTCSHFIPSLSSSFLLRFPPPSPYFYSFFSFSSTNIPFLPSVFKLFPLSSVFLLPSTPTFLSPYFLVFFSLHFSLSTYLLHAPLFFFSPSPLTQLFLSVFFYVFLIPYVYSFICFFFLFSLPLLHHYFILFFTIFLSFTLFYFPFLFISLLSLTFIFFLFSLSLPQSSFLTLIFLSFSPSYTF